MVIDTQQNNPAVDEKEPNELEKLKTQNAEFEKELLKAQQMRQEKQKIEAELMLGSTAGQPIPQKQVTQEDLDKQAAKEFWKGTGIEEAIDKYNG
jgi:cell shape-determining protein MreC